MAMYFSTGRVIDILNIFLKNLIHNETKCQGDNLKSLLWKNLL